LPSDEFINKHVLLFGVKNQNINVFYLHGAVHIFDFGLYTFKIRKDRKDDTFLSLPNVIDRLEEIIENEEAFIHFKTTMVLEGLSEFKERYMSHSMYLSDVYNRLDTIKGSIVIYGCNILDKNNKLNNDLHVWRMVFKKNKFNRIYIGIYDYIGASAFKQRMDAITENIKLLRGSNSDLTDVVFFSTKQQPTIWDRYE
jgi:hypothetical protein